MVTDRLAAIGPHLPRRTRRAIPVADAFELRRVIRRTTVIRLALALAIVALGAVAVWRATRLEVRSVSFLPAQQSTIVVLDQSKSVYQDANRRVAALLRKLVAADPSVGLVAFSDTAYELMPPGSHGRELKPLLRFYTPAQGSGATIDPSTGSPISPWTNGFSGGTRISSGLALAQRMLSESHARRGTILLVSDLGTASEDVPVLTSWLLALRAQSKIELRIVSLFPTGPDKQFFERLVGTKPFVKPSELAVHGHPQAQRSLRGALPLALIVAGALLLLALAANELLCARVELPQPKEATT